MFGIFEEVYLVMGWEAQKKQFEYSELQSLQKRPFHSHL